MTGVPSAWRRRTGTRSPSRSPPTSRWAARPACSRAAPSTCRSSSTSARCPWLMADALSGACSSMADRTPTGASASPPEPPRPSPRARVMEARRPRRLDTRRGGSASCSGLEGEWNLRRLIKIYDTTLRDGTQGEGVSFSMEDKVRLTSRLDALGIHYIEGGWPGSTPKDLRCFRRMQDVNLKHAKLAAFSMTRRAGGAAANDANMQALVEAGAPVVTIVGKSWDFHVAAALDTTLDENLAMIEDTIAYLRPRMDEVVFDAEHFFDGFRANREYALATLRAAETAGAHWLVLCDTNGGTLPHELTAILREVTRHVKTPLGIHVHNDAECAVANSLAAVSEGVSQVQGTINGYGERCGNANLISIIPTLVLKMGLDRDTPDSRRILDRLKQLEDEGFQFEGAEASFELLMERALGRYRAYFELDAYRVIVEEQSGDGVPVAEATVRVRVKGMLEHTAAAGNGPVNALDHALRKALEEFYPNLKEMRLLDYKVRILDEPKGTAAKTRVLITSGDAQETWGTVGVADNIIEASWLALVDSVEYKLRADERRRASA